MHLYLGLALLPWLLMYGLSSIRFADSAFFDARDAALLKDAGIEGTSFGTYRLPDRMHARGGFEQEGALATAWSVVVDLGCLAMIV